MSRFASSSLTMGQVNALVKKVGGAQAVLDLLRGKGTFTPTTGWTKQDGVIHMTLTPDGTTPEEWETKLESQGYKVRYDVGSHLRSPTMHKHVLVETTRVAILTDEVFGDQTFTLARVGAEAVLRQYLVPPIQLACMIRDAFSNSEIQSMGLNSILIMHTPVCNDIRPDARKYQVDVRSNEPPMGLAMFGYAVGELCDKGNGYAYIIPNK